MKVSIIVAMDEKRGIGKDNKLLWHIPGELPRFKRITTGHPIIMGRKTWESLPFKPLPNRTNIVVTRNSDFSFARGRLAKLAGNLEDGIGIAKESIGADEIFIIGGGQIFEQALPFVNKLYLTVVEGDFGADTFFPDYSEFKKIVSEEKREADGYKYKFLELEK